MLATWLMKESNLGVESAVQQLDIEATSLLDRCITYKANILIHTVYLSGKK